MCKVLGMKMNKNETVSTLKELIFYWEMRRGIKCIATHTKIKGRRTGKQYQPGNSGKTLEEVTIEGSWGFQGAERSRE